MDYVSLMGELQRRGEVAKLIAQLARLIAGASTSSNKPKPNTPAERLQTCTRICSSLRVSLR
jgi:hypothetical protein